MSTESKSVEVIMRRRRVLFAGFMARMDDTRTAEVGDVRRNDGGRRERRGAGKLAQQLPNT